MNLKRVFLVFIILMLGATFVYADNTVNSYEIQLKTEDNVVQIGENVDVELWLKNVELDVENGENDEYGLYGLMCNLEYDTDVLELNTITGAEDWATPVQVDSMISVYRKDMLTAANTEQKVITLQFTVKDNLDEKNTEIKVTDIEASDGEKNLQAENVELVLEFSENGELEENIIDNETTPNFMTNVYIIVAVASILIVIMLVLLIVVVAKKNKKARRK